MDRRGDISTILNHLNQSTLIQIALVLSAAWLLIVAVQRVLPRLADRLSGKSRLRMLASVPMLRLFIMVVAIALIIPRVIEPTFANLVALLGAFGLALGFALREYISSLIAGVVALYEMVYRPGDWVEIDGAYGEVKSIGMRAVKIVTPDDTVVVIPHLKLWDHLIRNGNDGSRNLLCVTDYYLHSQHDAALVTRTLNDVALTSPFIQLERPIAVVAQEKPWGTHYRLKAYPIDPREQFRFITDLTVRGKAALAELGATFAAALPVATAEH